MTDTTRAASPDAIVDIAIGFMGAKQLISASRIGLFSAIAEGAATVDEIAAATETPAHQVRILADSMAAQGLLERSDRRYALTPDAAAYLTGEHAELDLGPFLAFLGSTSYNQWLGYDKTVDTDAAGVLELDEAGWGDFLAGVMRYNDLHAAELVKVFDVAPFRDALDFGGLAAGFSIAAMQANPDLRVRFVFDEDSLDWVDQGLAAAGLADRAVVEGGPTATTQPGGAHDLVFLNHVIHRFDADANRAIVRAARDAAAEGATLVVLDFFLDDAPVQRKIDALHAGEYYNIDGTVVYPQAEVEQWLTDAGWKPLEVRELAGSPRILIAQAV